MQPNSLPPGPEQSALLQWTQWLRHPMSFLDKCSKRYGNVFTVRFPGRPPAVWMAEPAAAEAIFATERDSFEARAGGATNVFSAFVGQGSLLMMTGPPHRQERRLLDPPFHGQHLANCEGPLREVTDAAIGRFPLHRSFPLYPVLEDIASSVNFRTLLRGTSDESCERLKQLFFRYIKALEPNPLSRITSAAGIRLPRLPRLNPKESPLALKKEIYGLLAEELARCRTEGGGRTDILAKLVAAREADSPTQSEADVKICDQILTIFITGHGTTAAALSWTFGLILQRPDVLERIHQEIRQVFGDQPADPASTAGLKYMDAVIKESLRLHPPFLLVTRFAVNPVSLAGYELPAGTPVALSTYLMHRRPDLWPQPDEFRPERFLDRRPSPFEYLPFGGGHRTCVGNSFATAVSRGIVARFLSRATFRLTPGTRLCPERWQSFPTPQGGPSVIVDEIR